MEASLLIVMDKLIDANYLRRLVPQVSVKVLHNEGTVGMFMSLD